MKKICLTIPVYNNEESLIQLYNRLKESLKKNKDIDYNFIFVDDDSSDNSRVIIKEICKSDAKVVGIFLSKNFGQAAAICAGLDNSEGDYFGTLDADLEDPPEIIHEMINQIKDEKFDVIIAERISTKVNLFRKILSKITYLFFRIYFKDSPKNGFNVWLMNKKMFAEFSKITNGYPQYEIYELGFRKKIIPYEREKSKNRKSNQSILKLFNIFLGITIKSSDLLFKYIFIIAFVIFLLSFVNFLYMLIDYYINPIKKADGLYAILTYISFFGTINLLFLAIIGNYLFKIIKDNSKNKKYYIKEIVNNLK